MCVCVICQMTNASWWKWHVEQRLQLSTMESLVNYRMKVRIICNNHQRVLTRLVLTHHPPPLFPITSHSQSWNLLDKLQMNHYMFGESSR